VAGQQGWICRSLRLRGSPLQKSTEFRAGTHASISFRPGYHLRRQGHSAGLLVNELVTNAVKYAYVDGPGVIRVDAREIDGNLLVEISDEGSGLPEGFDVNQPRKSLGFRVINGLVRQLMGELKISKNLPRGALFTIKFPLDLPQTNV